MIIKVADKEYCIDGYINSGLQKLVYDTYQQGRAEAIDDVERELLRNGFIATHHALEVWHEIAEQLKEQKNER